MGWKANHEASLASTIPQIYMPLGSQVSDFSANSASANILIFAPATTAHSRFDPVHSAVRERPVFAQSRHVLDGRTVKRIAALAVRVTTTTR
jgi:hypothetical protein